MRSSRFVAPFLALMIWATPGIAADLAKIDRALVKEPAYQSKAPRYCLLVFGKEAKTRVWLVLDGANLYVDRNGNGDLTEAGKKLSAANGDDGSSRQGSFVVGEILERDGQTKHTSMTVYANDEHFGITVAVAGKVHQHAGFDRIDLDSLRFAERPQAAPIIHFGGPLTLHLSRKLESEEDKGISAELFAELGTPGLGKGSFASMSYKPVPEGVHPVAEIEWPVNSAGAPPKKTTVVLAKRC